jgi:hypothetical protein
MNKLWLQLPASNVKLSALYHKRFEVRDARLICVDAICHPGCEHKLLIERLHLWIGCGWF